ncbi:MAG TPA: hypothetical protein VHV30_11210 [Polyangiaceae bacterium]|jgi:hypothetical protein|nr:hypothetical protein [Polyangiaceae bacterium]
MPTRRPSEEDDDELEELPPIDGGLGEDSGENGDALRDIDEMNDPEASGAPADLDDSTGEDEPPDLTDLEGDEDEKGWIDESSESPELDLDALALLDAGEERLSLEDGEEPPAADEDFGIGESGESFSFDAADEGPLGADEELREADLPALDADDGDDIPRESDDGMLDERVAGEQPLGAPWAAEPWVRVGPPLGLARVGLARGITALACAARGALVAGRAESGETQLVRVDLEGARQVLGATGLDGARVAALAVEGDAVAAVLDGGRVAVSADGGDRFEPLAIPEGVAAADVAFVGGVLWVRTRTGSLLVARRDAAGKATVERRTIPSAAAALSRDEGRTSPEAQIVALAVDAAGEPSTLVRGKADATVTCEAVQPSGERPVGAMAARGDRVAYLAAGRPGVVLRQLEGGWRRVTWEGRATALAMIDDAGTVVVATYSESDDATGLVRVGGAGETSVVAKLGPARDDAESDGRAVAMAYDEPRGVVWVAGGFGVAAFTVR